MVIKTLAKCLREYKKPTIFTLVFIALEVFIEVLIPFFTADMVNMIKASVPMRDVAVLGVKLTVMALASMCCGAVAARACASAASGFARNVRRDMYVKVQEFSFHNVDKFSTASLVTRMTTDVNNVQMTFMMLIRTAIRAPLMFMFAIVMAFIMGGALAGTFIVVVPVLIFGLLKVAKTAMPAFRAVFRKYDKLNESIEENVRAMRVVKGFSREEYEKEKFGRASDNICMDFTKADRIVALNNPIMQFCVYFNMVFILTVGSMLIVKYSGTIIDVGQISAMLTYAMQVLMSLMMLSMVYVMTTISAESARRIVEVLQEEASIVNPVNALTEVADGSIDFEDVSFKYSDKAKKYALSDVDLHIESGMTVGILGGTGSSKTSLVQLIPRLYDVTEGTVRVGGRDVREYDLEILRDSVSMVLQKNLLFSGTIKENLRWGNENASDEEIIEACKLAQAHDFVMSFEKGYDHYIEQGGTNVSGGQKQRLCIARALLKRPKILILDDSTSAVDSRTDAFIREGFRTFIPETTKIIIAQRVASVMDADLIIIMENGRIADKGSHADLLERSEIYREIYQQQTKGGEDNE